MSSFYDIGVESIDHEKYFLSRYRDKVVLVVNVASKCGFTPQYEGLEKLYQDYKDQGFVILACPCNQFGSQEPGTDEEIKGFCETNYKTSFPITTKIEVNGTGQHHLYEWLKSNDFDNQGDVQWNFEKFLIGKKGKFVKRYKSNVTPQDLTTDISSELKTEE